MGVQECSLAFLMHALRATILSHERARMKLYDFPHTFNMRLAYVRRKAKMSLL
jgi:hypothetical protein